MVRLGLAALVVWAVAGCGVSDGATVVADARLTCDHDVASTQAKGWVERVGGRHSDGYRVTLARSTPVGVIALVEGDAQAAYDDLNTVAEVSEVATQEPDGDAGTITGLSQIADLVAAACG